MIKGGFFLKSLKQLFIILLISCFTLLVNSSVSATFSIENQELGDTITKNLNFIPNPLDLSSNYPDVLTHKYGRTDDGYIYLAVEEKPGQYSYGSHYGIIRFEYNVPVGSNSPSTPNLSFYEAVRDGTFKPVKFTVIGGGGSNSYNILVFYDKDGNYYQSTCAFIKEGSLVNFTCGYGNNGYEGISYSVVGSFPNSQFPVNNSPFSLGGGTVFIPSTGSRLGGRLITNSGYTNSQMVEAYECVGLQPALCYGGFPITDIFQPGENYEDFTGYVAGQGATIFDLYNRYSGSFSNINQFLNTVLTRYQNRQINSFITEPKALLMLGAQMNTAGLKTSYISTYCDLLLNKNNSSIYTGNSVDDLRAQSCYRSQYINDSLKNSDGSDIIGQGSDVGIFGSGDDVDFDPETFFSNMMEKISSGLNNVSTGTAVGIIPGYIILFTLALIFIRLISH